MEEEKKSSSLFVDNILKERYSFIYGRVGSRAALSNGKSFCLLQIESP